MARHSDTAPDGLSPWPPSFGEVPPEFSCGHVFGGRYHVLEPLARGSMGELYLASDIQTASRVAIKTQIADPEKEQRLRARFAREIQLLQRVAGHPNVITILDNGLLPDGRRFFVMEYADEDTAWTGTEAACRFALFAAAALEHIHAQGIVHRDIKPDNILDAAAPKLVDFGVAADLSTASDPDVTRSGELVGTIEYMSPAQLAGAAPTPSFDIYALGTTLFEMLADRRPYKMFERGVDALREAKETEPPPYALRFDAVPESIRTVVLRCISPTRTEDRISDARTFQQELRSAMVAAGFVLPRAAEPDALQASSFAETQPTTGLPPSPRQLARGFSRVAMAAVVIPFLLAAATVLLLRLRTATGFAALSASPVLRSSELPSPVDWSWNAPDPLAMKQPAAELPDPVSTSRRPPRSKTSTANVVSCQALGRKARSLLNRSAWSRVVQVTDGACTQNADVQYARATAFLRLGQPRKCIATNHPDPAVQEVRAFCLRHLPK